MTRILGISALSHDAALAVIEDGQIKFAAHTERTSRIKNYKYIDPEAMKQALSYGMPDVIAFYERPVLKKTRQAYAGQWDLVTNTDDLPWNYLDDNFPELMDVPIKYIDHHLSHAATGALTSNFDHACIVVADAIGEWDCLSIWKYTHPCKFEKLYSAKYPHSLGLFYTAMTHRCGLKPNEDEYILMGMAAYGKPIYANDMLDLFFDENEICKLRTNLHRGCSGYEPDADVMDIAASAQLVIETKITEVMKYAKEITGENNLIYMGGVSLNCVANSSLGDHFDNIWVCPNPGDAGSALGSAAYVYGDKIQWEGPYLGYEIKGKYPVKKVLAELLKGNIVGIANGKAEFGPRALGNRTLTSDPRGPEIKDKMNEIKRRQKFRPFAPMILEEYVHDYFEMPNKIDKSPYMQYVAKCKDPELFPAIVHEDGTSRVQTVNCKEHPGLYELLRQFYKQTGCPMLVNTSLNIKGQPIVNCEKDAKEFELHYGVKVFTKDN